MTNLDTALRVKELMADPVMVAAFAGVRAGMVSQLEDTAFGDAQTHHEVALMLQLLKRVREQLNMYSSELEIEQKRRRDEAFVSRTRETYRP